MRKMIYNVSGFRTTSYAEVKALNKPFTIEFEDVKPDETAAQKEKRLERIKKRKEALKNKAK